MEKTPTTALGKFNKRFPDFFSVDESGAKKLGIDTRFVNPAFKPAEVPDYRTEHEAMSAGADAWEKEVVGDADTEEKTELIGQDFKTEDVADPRDEELEVELPSDIIAKPELETISSGSSADGDLIEEPTDVIEVVVDDKQIDRIISRMRESAANINSAPQSARLSIVGGIAVEKNIEPEPGSEQGDKAESVLTNDAIESVPENTDKKLRAEYLDLVSGLESSLKNNIESRNLDETSSEYIAFLRVAVDLRTLLEIGVAKVDGGDEMIKVTYNDLQKEKFDTLFEELQRLYQESLKAETKEPVAEVKNTILDPKPLKRFLNVNNEVKVEEINQELIAEVENELKGLDTDLNLLTGEVDAWKADLQTRKSYRRVKDEIKTLIQEHKDGTKVASKELVSEKMQRLRDLHEAIFEFEMRQNNMVDENNEPIVPVEPASEAFVDSDEPELLFDDLPNVTKEDYEAGVKRLEAIEKRNDELEGAAEVASAAENLMLNELRSKGMEREWTAGKYLGVVRALSEMRVDDFLRTKEAGDKSRVWLSDLQERAGAFAPRIEPNILLNEYVPKLYQSIIKAQRHAERTGNEGTRARLLGI